MNFDELTTLLGAEEESLNESNDVKETFAMAVNATLRSGSGGYYQYNNRGRGRNNNNRGRGNGGGRASNAFPHQFSSYTSNQNHSN